MYNALKYPFGLLRVEKCELKYGIYLMKRGNLPEEQWRAATIPLKAVSIIWWFI